MAAKGIEATITQQKNIYIQTPHLQEAAKVLEEGLYNSIFFKGAKVAEEAKGDEVVSMPYSLGICDRCIKEMMDPTSRRYFYPFTSCATCSNQAAFAFYPYKRANSLLLPFKPCKECQKELEQNFYRKDYPLISCADCAIAVVLRDKTKEFWANESKEFKQAFSILANALKDGKRVAIKGLGGYRTFSLHPFKGAKLLIANAALALQKLLLLPQEKRILFSIERPQIFATIGDSQLKAHIGDIARVMAFDDGFSFLLVSLLQDEPFLFWQEGSGGDLVMEYLLEPKRYQKMEAFFFKNREFFLGEQAALPKPLESQKCVVEKDAALYEGVIDKIESFPDMRCAEVIVFEDCVEHSNIKRAQIAKAALRSVLQEHNILDQKAVGFYFGEAMQFYYFNTRAKLLFDFGKIPKDLQQKIAGLREGSDRLLKNFLDRFNVDIQQGDFWQRAARIIGIDGGYEELRLVGMQYGGKGGVSVDCEIGEDGFCYAAFYASLMSYRLAGAEAGLLAYSIFESLGEFASQQLRALGGELGASNFILAGRYITNSPFFSRFLRNIPTVKLNREFPVDGFNAIYGVL